MCFGHRGGRSPDLRKHGATESRTARSADLGKYGGPKGEIKLRWINGSTESQNYGSRYSLVDKI